MTSLTWLDPSKAYGPTGAVWTHTTLVIVPKHLKHDNASLAIITGEVCNEEPNVLSKHKDPDVMLGD